MYKISLICAVLVALLVSEGYGVPQGRRVRQGQQQEVHQEHHMDPVKIEQEMTSEHAKLIENLQRLKRTLEVVKEKVGKGAHREPTKPSDIKTPETAILTVLQSLQEQGQLFAMINDMIKAGSEVTNQTAKIQHYAELDEQARAEASNAESTNHIVPSPVVAVAAAAAPSSTRATSRRDNEIHMKMKDDHMNPAKHHGYDDYQYQYRDDAGDSTGDDQYDYHYDAGGYDESPSSAKGKVRGTTTTTTTTTRKPSRRVRTRGRQEYY